MKVQLLYLKTDNNLQRNCTENSNSRDLYAVYCVLVIGRRAL